MSKTYIIYMTFLTIFQVEWLNKIAKSLQKLKYFYKLENQLSSIECPLATFVKKELIP